MVQLRGASNSPECLCSGNLPGTGFLARFTVHLGLSGLYMMKTVFLLGSWMKPGSSGTGKFKRRELDDSGPRQWVGEPFETEESV